jgi:hypothetical protein
MAARGHYYALDDRQRTQLLSLSDDDLISFFHELYGQLSDRDHQGVDKAWDAIHRCLTGDSSRGHLNPLMGPYPLNQCVLGGKWLYDGEDYIVTLIEPAAVRDLAAALEKIDDAWMERAYHKYCRDLWPEYGDEDCGYTLGWFEDLKIFLKRAAQANRAVVFCADQ